MRDLLGKAGIVLAVAIFIAFFLPVLGLIVGITGGIFFGAESIKFYIDSMFWVSGTILGVFSRNPEGFHQLMLVLVWGALNVVGLGIMSQSSRQ